MKSLWNIACAVLVIGLATAASAQTFNTLFYFDGTDGSGPWGLVQGRDGNFYSTTEDYGPPGWSCHFFGCGSVFKITPDGLATLYVFCAPDGYPPCKTGEGPEAGLVLATDGNFYGTTEWGGGGNRGEVFRITPTGSLVRLAFNEGDGLNPTSPLAQGADGDLYGTTGGTTAGSVFKVSPPGILTVLYSFCSLPNCADGSEPTGGLVQATDGSFYGTTQTGGTGAYCTGLGCGTVFKITPKGMFTTLYSFCSQPNCADGIFPTAPLVQATDGNLYGTTSSTAFKLTLSGELTRLYTFCSQPNCADGNDANGLVQATDGNFYGTTQSGGNQTCGIPPEYDCGTIFELTPTGTLTTVHSFVGTDGWEPRTGLLQATSGTFYGSTWGSSTIFSLSMGLGPSVAFVQRAAKIGQTAEILGQGFTGTTNVSFNGISTKFTVQSDTYLTAKVPAGATTGYVTVTTPSGVLKSNVPFQVIR